MKIIDDVELTIWVLHSPRKTPLLDEKQIACARGSSFSPIATCDMRHLMARTMQRVGMSLGTLNRDDMHAASWRGVAEIGRVHHASKAAADEFLIVNGLVKP